MPTERLYYNDSHLTEFDARVVGAAALPTAGLTAVTLDRTAFYPTGGGQPSDTGRLGSARVVECVDRADEGVLHVVEGPPSLFPAGETLRGRVDWARRFDHLQQHTGQHILSQSLIKLYGAETRAFRMAEHHAEIDVEFADSPGDERGERDERDRRVERAIDLANQIVWEDRAVRTRFVTADEARGLPLRRESGREGTLRLIEIEDFDLNACGGTHARRTGEVGLIAVRSWERAKGRLTRLEFVCGRRALDDYRRANGDARRTAALLGVGRADIAEAVRQLQAAQKLSLRRLREYDAEAAARRGAALLAEAPRRAADAARVIAAELPADFDVAALKSLAQSLISPRDGGDDGGGVIALLAAADAGASANDVTAAAVRLVFARSADLPDEMNALLRDAAAALGGRGGGSASFAQGGGRATPQQLTRTLRALRDRLLAAG